jgi:hypothetical protein
MKRQTSISLSAALLAAVKAEARAQRRTLSSLLELWLEARLGLAPPPVPFRAPPPPAPLPLPTGARVEAQLPGPREDAESAPKLPLEVSLDSMPHGLPEGALDLDINRYLHKAAHTQSHTPTNKASQSHSHSPTEPDSVALPALTLVPREASLPESERERAALSRSLPVSVRRTLTLLPPAIRRASSVRSAKSAAAAASTFPKLMVTIDPAKVARARLLKGGGR